MMKNKWFTLVMIITMMVILPVSANQIQANLRKTGSFEDYSVFEGGSIYVNEYADWSVTYNAGSEEIVSCRAEVTVIPESIVINWGDDDWQFSNISTSTLSPQISSGGGACTLGYNYSFNARKFIDDEWVTKYITNTKRFEVTAEGLVSQ